MVELSEKSVYEFIVERKDCRFSDIFSEFGFDWKVMDILHDLRCKGKIHKEWIHGEVNQIVYCVNRD